TFPQRNLVLFITFVVILVTLVIQGLSLPFLIRYMNIQVNENETGQEQAIRLRLAAAVLSFMESEYGEESETIDAFNRLKARYERMVEISDKKLMERESETSAPSFLPKYRQMLLEIVAVRRKELTAMRRDHVYSDELLKKKEFELDLEEARLRR
ncbi:MAG: Na+/H+ antiporter, partial [Bacteroidota bacterium]